MRSMSRSVQCCSVFIPPGVRRPSADSRSIKGANNITAVGCSLFVVTAVGTFLTQLALTEHVVIISVNISLVVSGAQRDVSALTVKTARNQ